MQKALSELERSGLIYTVRTSGRFVTEDVGMIENMKKETIMEKIRTFIIEMKAMGLNAEEILEFIKRSEDELK